MVATHSAQFYKSGPAQDFDYPDPRFSEFMAEQASGPDFELPKGATVTMIKRELGYSYVRTSGGIAAYVANDQLRPAPAPPRTPGPDLRGVRGNSRARTGNVRPPPRPQREEQLDLHDLPLPG